MSEGGYGIIFSCKTNLVSPSEQMNLPDSVYERCVLNDIFSEISCLENFRLDPKVTDVYDYGVTDNSYVIIMKRYRFSLRYWRRMQKEVNLPLLLGMFREILKVVKLLHEHSVTHYDIKADNILIDCDSE
jgi:serine/threonine protein kinase